MTGQTETTRNIGIDYLRAFIIFLVVTHHAVLAYTSSANGALINDPDNFSFFDYLAGYNDVFFMFLLFFISGLFTLESLQEKGIREFLTDRFLRLMVPFTFAMLFINVFGYYLQLINYYRIQPSFESFSDYFIESFGLIPIGPLWFLWVLFAFDLIVSLIYKIYKNWYSQIVNSQNKFFTNSVRFLTIFSLISIGIFFLSYTSDFGHVQIFPPFVVQVSRLHLYFWFFLTGVLIGAYGFKRSLFKEEGGFSKFWWIFLGSSIPLYLILKSLIDYIYSGNASNIYLLFFLIWIMLVLCSASSSFGLVGLFNRIFNKEYKFFNLVSKNVLGIYVVHFSIVTIFQYLLLKIEVSGLFKGIFVSICSFFVSFAIVLLLNKIPFIRMWVGYKYKGIHPYTLITISCLLIVFVSIRMLLT